MSTSTKEEREEEENTARRIYLFNLLYCLRTLNLLRVGMRAGIRKELTYSIDNSCDCGTGRRGIVADENRVTSCMYTKINKMFVISRLHPSHELIFSSAF